MASAPFYRDDARPFAQRQDGMSLDIIRANDIPKGKVLYVKDELTSLRTDDLPRARPHYEHLQYLNKPDLSVGCTDPGHPGSHARSYYAPMDRRPRDLSLTTADIEYAQPKNTNWKGNRHTDPVCPTYELPSCVKREATPPRWNGRHTNDISDIEHTRPKVLHPDRNYQRDPNDSRDIEYASSNYQERVQRQGSYGPGEDRTLNVQDINGPRRMQPRCTNPLEPVYKVPTNRTTSLHVTFNEEQAMGVELPMPEPHEIGEVQGSKPRKLQWDNGEPQFSLLREDIAGTVPQRWVGSVPHNIYDPPEVRPMLSFHDPCDIPGAQVSSLKRGIHTRRVVNPLNPRYPALDGDNKPESVPVIPTERQAPGTTAHPLLRTQAAASSLPNLRGPQAASSAAASSRQDGSEVAFRRGAQQEGQYQPSWTPSSGRSSQAHGPSGHALMQQGATLRLPLDASSRSGDLSRRSGSSQFLPRGVVRG